MKRLLVLAAFLGSIAFAGVVYAQDGTDKKPASDTEQPKKDDGDAKKDDGAKKDDTAKKDDRRNRFQRRNQRMDRRAYQEIGRIMREQDTDRDRKLSKAEFGDDGAFKKLDKDGDGYLTLQEMAADSKAVIAAAEKHRAAVTKEEFGILDRNSDGKLTKEELGKDFEGLLDKGDTDKDGQLSLDEFTKAREQSEYSEAGKGPIGGGDPFKQLDKDGDGKISKEEAPDRLKQIFDRADTDGDGKVSREELKALKDKLRRGNRTGRKPGDDKKKEEPKKEDSDKKDSDSDKKDDMAGDN